MRIPKNVDQVIATLALFFGILGLKYSGISAGTWQFWAMLVGILVPGIMTGLRYKGKDGNK